MGWENVFGNEYSGEYISSPNTIFAHVLETNQIKISRLESGSERFVDVGRELKERRTLVEWMVPRVKMLRPLAEIGAAFRISRWWRRRRALCRWNFVRDHILGFLEANRSRRIDCSNFAQSAFH